MNPDTPRPAPAAAPEKVDQPDAEDVRFVRWLADLRVSLAETVGGVLLRGARPVAVGGGGTRRPLTASGALVGYSLRNRDAGAATVVRLLTQDTGDLVAVETIAAGASVTRWFGPGGVNVANGLVVDVPGDVEGVVFLRGNE